MPGGSGAAPRFKPLCQRFQRPSPPPHLLRSRKRPKSRRLHPLPPRPQHRLRSHPYRSFSRLRNRFGFLPMWMASLAIEARWRGRDPDDTGRGANKAVRGQCRCTGSHSQRETCRPGWENWRGRSPGAHARRISNRAAQPGCFRRFPLTKGLQLPLPFQSQQFPPSPLFDANIDFAPKLSEIAKCRK